MDRAADPRELHPSRDRTISRREIQGVTIGIPARNEEATVGDVVRRAHAALRYLNLAGEVLVAASGCTDSTARVASDAWRAGPELRAWKGKRGGCSGGREPP